MTGDSLRATLAVALVAGVAIFASLGLRPLEDKDYIRYPEVAREILELGDWSILHLHGLPYLSKPPLFFWCIAVVGKAAGGIGPWSARLPSALAAWGTVLLVYWIGVRLANRRAGMLAALILCTSSLFYHLAQMTRLEPLLAFFLTLGAAFYVHWRDAPKGGVGWGIALFAALGGAILVKGPITFLFLLPLVVFDGALRRDRGLVCAKILVPGLLIAAALTCLWLVPFVERFGWGRLGDLFHEEVVKRAEGEGKFFNPWWHYFAYLPVEFLPWTWFVPAAVWIGVRDRGKAAALPPVLAIWAIAPFLLLECSGGRIMRYLLPLFPAFALLLAISLERALDGPLDRVQRVHARLVPLLLAVGGAALPFVPPFPLPLAVSIPAALACIAAGLWILRGGDGRLMRGSIVALAAVALAWNQADALWGADARRAAEDGSYAEAGEGIRAAIGNRPLAGWEIEEEALEFYCERIITEVKTPAELAEWLAAHPDGLLLARPGTSVEGFKLEETARVTARKKKAFCVMTVAATGR